MSKLVNFVFILYLLRIVCNIIEWYGALFAPIGGVIINFQPIKLDDKPVFDSFFRARRYENAHFNFTNLFMWRHAFNIEWCTEAGFLLIRAAWGKEQFALQPFGPEAELGKAITIWEDYFKQNNLPFIISGIESGAALQFEKLRPGFFKFHEDRDNYDYIYSAQDLINLKGRKFHSKKNHFNNFKKVYSNFVYLPLSAELVGQCVATAADWFEKKTDTIKNELIDYEKNAIIEALTNQEYLDLTGGVIMINGTVEAFTFGEQLNADTAVIHVEKANADIRGIYPAINQQFVKHAWSKMRYINREEDMGLEGLRKSKLSYNPVKFVKKYVVTIRDQEQDRKLKQS
ncbi:MAG: DUF2156 domain-containing protein [Veillonellaceae bacterium]|jgi:hypothetical protein|nr:DUF2156 domain-containing protein [Veillonellaceae bacterium]